MSSSRLRRCENVCRTDGGNWPYTGVSVVAYETAERQVGAKPFDIPLRFPGQYFDAETQKHENWNRFYDPTTGRYLSPEPMLQSPDWVMGETLGGFSAPTYAYGRNNPVRFADPSGLFVTSGSCDLWERALEMARQRAGCMVDGSGKNRGTECTLDKSNECQRKLAECTGALAGGSGCNICEILSEGSGPPLRFVRGPLRDETGKPNPNAAASTRLSTDLNTGRMTVEEVLIEQRWCASTGVAARLATFILHEAAHSCSGHNGRAQVYISDEPSTCSAESIERACKW